MPFGVIFDMDGVLVDSGAPHHESWRQLAARHGLSVSDAAFAECFGLPSRDIVRRIWGPQVTADEIRRIDDEKEAVYRDLIGGHIPLIPGVRETLDALSAAGFVLAVGTSGPPENVHLVLDEAHLRPYFRAVVHGFDIQHGKPAPDVFLLAASRAGLTPRDCVVVEDAPVGIEAARAAGMPTIAYTGTHPANRLLTAGAATTVDHLAEITPTVVRRVMHPR